MSQPASPDIALFEDYPTLRGVFPYLPLANLPTPVTQAETFADAQNIGALHIKQDNLSGAHYGGNKVRKLGFLMAAARQMDARAVITFGAAGSNHALATAVYARTLGMGATLILGPQYNSRHVRANILAMQNAGAELLPCDWKHVPATTATAFFNAWQRDGSPPFVIPPGGSSPLGALGYVNAAFELKAQVEGAVLPEPDVIYVPSGTMGTCVGLALGLAAVGMKTQVMAVRVTTPPYTSLARAQSLHDAVAGMLHAATPAFPLLPWSAAKFMLRDEFLGEAYALFTREGMEAAALAASQLDMQLEGTYTGKTFAALLSDARQGLLHKKNVLFWNTFSGEHPLPQQQHTMTSTRPDALRVYFNKPSQPLDMPPGAME